MCMCTHSHTHTRARSNRNNRGIYPISGVNSRRRRGRTTQDEFDDLRWMLIMCCIDIDYHMHNTKMCYVLSLSLFRSLLLGRLLSVQLFICFIFSSFFNYDLFFSWFGRIRYGIFASFDFYCHRLQMQQQQQHHHHHQLNFKTSK